MRKLDSFPVAPILEHLGAVNVPYVHGSRWQPIKCPFHEDSAPSASVSEFGFNCHACGVSGDAIRLLRNQGGMSFADAKRFCEGTAESEGGRVSRASGWGQSLLE